MTHLLNNAGERSGLDLHVVDTQVLHKRWLKS